MRKKKNKTTNDDQISFIDWLRVNRITKIRYGKKSVAEKLQLRSEYDIYISNSKKSLQSYPINSFDVFRS